MQPRVSKSAMALTDTHVQFSTSGKGIFRMAYIIIIIVIIELYMDYGYISSLYVITINACTNPLRHSIISEGKDETLLESCLFNVLQCFRTVMINFK